MKKLLLILLTSMTISAYAQTGSRHIVSYSDPAVSNLQFSSASGGTVNSDNFTIGTPVKMQFVIGNNDALSSIPAGTCQLMITLGSRFRLVDDLASGIIPLSNYFHWSMDPNSRGTQYVVIGELYRDLPPRFSGNMVLNLMPYKGGSSTATCQVLISNNNPAATLSDMAPMNNFASRGYTANKPIGIRFTRFDAKPRGCTVEINWAIFDEAKITSKYIIETSDDGINFHAVKTVISSGNPAYTLMLEGLSKSSLTVRVRAETRDGQFLYSGNALVTNICQGIFEITLSPNPVPKEVTELTIQAKSGIFNGKYNIALTDATGKEIRKSDATCNDQVLVKFNTGFIPAGAYYISVTGENGQVNGMKFVKQ